jgi:hypothetical protein
MKLSLIEIEELEIGVTELMVNRRYLEDITVSDIVNDIIAYCNKASFEEKMKFAKKRINREINRKRFKYITIPKRMERRAFEKRWVQNAMINLPGFREKHNKQSKEYSKSQCENKTLQWFQKKANKVLARLVYKDTQISEDPICCKIHKGICKRLPERSNNHQENGCPKTDQYTLFNGHCIPNGHKYIKRIKDQS